MKRQKWIVMRNESNLRVVHEDLDIDVGPGEEVEVQEGYVMPRAAASGQRFPSILEQIAPQLKPVHAEDLDRWKKAPEAPTPAAAKMPTVKDLVAAGMAPGLAEMFIQSMHASLAEAKKALAEGGAKAPDQSEEVEAEAKKQAQQGQKPSQGQARK